MSGVRKSIKYFIIAILLVPCVFMLSACTDDTEHSDSQWRAIFNADLSSVTGATNVFLGNTTYDEDSDVIYLNSDGDQIGPQVIFDSTDNNLDWDEDGMIVSARLNLLGSDYATGDGFNYTISLNAVSEYQEFNTERSLFVRKYAEGLKVGYIAEGSSEEANETATSDDGAVTLEDGWYTIRFHFYENDLEEVKVTISVIDSDNVTVFEAKDQTYSNAENAVLKADEVLGIRSLSFSWLSISTENLLSCSALSVEVSD